VIFSDSKEFLHKVRSQLDDQLKAIGLKMKENWQVFPVDIRGVDFLGYRFFHDFTLVRKRIVQHFKRAFHANKTESIPAYNGWLSHANTHNLRTKYEYSI
jgi:hypothetical protein